MRERRPRMRSATTILWMRNKLAGMTMIGMTKRKLVRVKRNRGTRNSLRVKQNQIPGFNGRPKSPKFGDSGRSKGGYYPLFVR